MSRRVGTRQLERIRRSLTERDIAVLRSVAAHRYLSARQLESFHFAGHATEVSGARVSRRVLARLVELGVLSRLERRIGGVRAGSASYVYSLGPVGSRMTGRTRSGEPSYLFLEHRLAVGDAHLSLVRAARKRGFDLLQVSLEPACWRRFVGARGAVEHLRPDMYVVTGHGELERCWFVEVDRGTLSLPALLRKCDLYRAYWQSGAEQAAHGTFPKVVWSMSSPQAADRLAAALARGGFPSQLFRVVESERLAEIVAASGDREGGAE